MTSATTIVVTEVIAATHFAYPQRDGQVEFAWAAGCMPRLIA